MNLKQGGMTVREYDMKFTSLSRYAKAMIPNDFEKAKKFERGLHPDVHFGVAMLRVQTYNDVLEVALIIEEELKQGLMGQSCKRPRGSQFQGQKVQNDRVQEVL